MALRNLLQDAIRPSRTRSTAALWAKSALNAVLFASLFMVALPALAHWLAPAELPIPGPMRTWLAGALGAVGVAAWIACLDAFSRHGRGTPLPADAPRRLVTRGLFGWVRNPIILAELMVLWAIALSVASVGVGVYALLVTAAAHLVVVLVEEPELRRRFGTSYDEYCQRVPRWLPRPGGRRSSPA